MKRQLTTIVLAAATLLSSSFVQIQENPKRQKALEEITNAFDHTNLVIVGDNHTSTTARDFVRGAIPYLKAKGVNYYALELPFTLQRPITTYVNSGVVDTQLQNFLKEAPRARSYLEVARDMSRAGLTVILIDNEKPDLLTLSAIEKKLPINNKRDVDMAYALIHASTNSGAKVLAHTGLFHANHCHLDQTFQEGDLENVFDPVCRNVTRFTEGKIKPFCVMLSEGTNAKYENSYKIDPECKKNSAYTDWKRGYDLVVEPEERAEITTK